MKIVYLSVARDEVPRPKLVTPAKGKFGDCCHEEDALQTSVKAIMKRYAGNLEEMMRWRTKPLDFCDATIACLDLQEAINKVSEAKTDLENLKKSFGLNDDQVKQILGGDLSPFKKGTEDETKSSCTPEKSSDLSEDRKPAASEEHADK